jgi:predicted secreted protein
VFVRQTYDGGYVMAGRTRSFGAGGSDIWLVKADSAGTQEWAQTYGGSGYDTGKSVQQTADSGYIIVGTTASFGGGREIWLIKTDANGNQEWNRTFGGNENEEGNSVQQTADSGYILLGSTESFGAGQSDMWLIRLAAWTEPQTGITAGHEGPVRFALNQNYPNPFNPVSTIRYDLPKSGDVSLMVYDILGREVAGLVDSYLEPGSYQTTWDGRSTAGRELPSGIYIACLATPEYNESIKMVLLK